MFKAETKKQENTNTYKEKYEAPGNEIFRLRLNLIDKNCEQTFSKDDIKNLNEKMKLICHKGNNLHQMHYTMYQILWLLSDCFPNKSDLFLPTIEHCIQLGSMIWNPSSILHSAIEWGMTLIVSRLLYTVAM